MTETQAINLCLKHQDPAGFEFLVDLFRREAFLHAMGLLGHREDAADACQESFRRAFSAMPGLDRLDQFYPWFYRILRNCCLNMLARKQTAIRHSQETRRREGGSMDEMDPSVIVIREEGHRKIWNVLERLAPAFREILVLKYVEGRRYEEIAQLLNVPRGTVMSRLYHARKAFQKAYSPGSHAQMETKQ